MSLGYFNYPMPVNEPVLNYAPGSKEREILKNTLAELKDNARRKLKSGQKRKTIITACWKQAELW